VSPAKTQSDTPAAKISKEEAKKEPLVPPPPPPPPDPKVFLNRKKRIGFGMENKDTGFRAGI